MSQLTPLPIARKRKGKPKLHTRSNVLKYTRCYQSLQPTYIINHKITPAISVKVDDQVSLDIYHVSPHGQDLDVMQTSTSHGPVMVATRALLVDFFAMLFPILPLQIIWISFIFDRYIRHATQLCAIWNLISVLYMRMRMLGLVIVVALIW